MAKNRFHEHFISDANGSRRMLEDDFQFFLEHCKKHVNPLKGHRKLLLLNIICRTCLQSIEFSRKYGIQPMDRIVFCNLKRANDTASNNWMQSSPGKTMSTYDVPCIAKPAFNVVVTAKNISAQYGYFWRR